MIHIYKCKFKPIKGQTLTMRVLGKNKGEALNAAKQVFQSLGHNPDWLTTEHLERVKAKK